jgi:hypothetical protein
MGLTVSKVSVDVTGHIDLRGFLAVDDTKRPGFHTITGTVTVESTATDAQLQVRRASSPRSRVGLPPPPPAYGHGAIRDDERKRRRGGAEEEEEMPRRID